MQSPNKTNYEISVTDLHRSSLESGELEPTSSRFDPHSHLKRGLKTRHVSLIALGGLIGPGLIASYGTLLHKGGPATLLIDFSLLGTIAFAVIQSVGELSSLFSATNGFSNHMSRFVDEAFAAACSYNYLIIWIAVAASEYNSLCATMVFWAPEVPIYGYFLLFWTFFMAIQFLGVVGWGEAEYWLALTKLVGLTAFYLFTLVYMCGGISGTPAFGFKNFNTPWGDHSAIKSLATIFTGASTAYAGVEMISISASETSDPVRSIKVAVHQIMYRIVYIYFCATLCYGITVPYDSPEFSNSAGALRSPMTIAIQNAGWQNGHHLINAFILVTAFSAINTSIYIGSRTLVHLANENMVPFASYLKITNKQGVPYVSSITFHLFCFISLMNIKTGSANAFSYIVNISGISTFIVWAGLSYTQLRFRIGWVKSGRSVDDLPFKCKWYPWTAAYSIFMNVFLALVQGWTYFKPFDASNFVDCYILLPLFPIFFFGYKFIKKTKWIRYEDMDFETGRRRDLELLAIERKQAEIEERAENGILKYTLAHLFDKYF